MSPNQLTARALETLLGEWRTNGTAYRALADRIRLLTLDGRIPTDSRLPAERDLGTGSGSAAPPSPRPTDSYAAPGTCTACRARAV